MTYDAISNPGQIPTIQTPKHAAVNYSTHTSPQSYDNAPAVTTFQGKPKWTFWVEFNRNKRDGAEKPWEKRLLFEVKQVDRPRVNFDHAEIQQYNKKRQVYKQIQYQQVQIRFIDSIAHSAFEMYKDFARHYFADFNRTDREDWYWDLTRGTFDTTGANAGRGWGFNPSNVDSDQDSYYFSTIDIHHVHGRIDYKMTLVNPKIISFDPDDLDMANGQEFSSISMSLAYEGIIMSEGSVFDPQFFANAETVFGGPRIGEFDPGRAEAFESSPYPSIATFVPKSFVQNQEEALYDSTNLASQAVTNAFSNQTPGGVSTIDPNFVGPLPVPGSLNTSLPDNLLTNNVSATNTGFTGFGSSIASAGQAASQTAGRALSALGIDI
jgi:hypothetical protein